jgi:hypothetical protein
VRDGQVEARTETANRHLPKDPEHPEHPEHP